MNFDTDAVYDSDAGCFLSQRMKHLATILKDYNPDLELRWIKPGYRVTPEDHKNPYAIIHRMNGKEYPVMHFGETQAPEQILEKVFLADMSRHNVMDELSKRNAAVRARQLFTFQDEMAERADVGKFLLETKKTNPIIRDKDTGELVKLDSNLQRVGKIRKNM